MASFESNGKKTTKNIETDSHSREWKAHPDIEEKIAKAPEYEPLRNKLFEQYMEQHLIELFFETAADVGYSEAMIREAQNELSSYNDNEILGALSLPHELREKWIEKSLKLIENGERTPSEVIRELIGLGRKYGFKIGYHTSPQDIKPDTGDKWNIRGTEKDHRDGDMTMAYYSNQYRHLFKLKNPQFIYVVRAEKDHRSDGNWNRAPTLSVIMRLPFGQVHQYVENAARSIEDEGDKKMPRAE